MSKDYTKLTTNSLQCQMQKNRLFIALSVSFALHFIVFLIFLNFTKELKLFYPPSKDSKSFTNIQFVKLSQPKISNHYTPKHDFKNYYIPTPIASKPIEIPLQKTEEAKIVIPQHQPIQEISKPQETTKPIQPIQEKKETQESTSLNNFLLSKEKATEPDETTKSYIKLYGEEFYNFEPKTKQYLIANLGKIGSITQKYLKYPTLSIKTKQQGVNTVEFMLHPNGDITDLKLISSSTYSALDQNSLRTIQIAYKDYPKPSIPTKIKIYINYIYGILY